MTTKITDVKKRRIGFFAKNLTTGKTFAFHDRDEFGTASIIKICIALTLYDQACLGHVDLDEPIEFSSQDQKDKLGKYANGLLSYLKKDATTLRLACCLMLRLSDNAATNIILEHISKNEVNAYLRKHNLTSTKLTCNTLDPKKLETTGNLLGTTTAKEMSLIMEKLVSLAFFKDEITSNEIISMMESNSHNATFTRYLPTYWNAGIVGQKITRVINKGGSFPKFELLAETGCVTTDKGEKIVISIFTQGITFNGKSFPANLNPDHPANFVIAETVKKLFNLLY